MDGWTVGLKGWVVMDGLDIYDGGWLDWGFLFGQMS